MAKLYRSGRRINPFVTGIVFLLAGSVAISPTPAAAGDIDLTYIPVDLRPGLETVTTVGALRYRGGLEVSSSDKRFGGFSGLIVDTDGGGLAAVSDRGHWLTARLRHDRTGNLAGIDDGRMKRLRDLRGKRFKGKRSSDAEAMARTGGRIAVSFERRHRIVLYPGGPAGKTASNARFKSATGGHNAPRALSDDGWLPHNQGLEALTALDGGRLLAFAEGLDGAFESWPGWIIEGAGKTGARWRRLNYARTGLFRPTGAATLPNGDVLVLERRFTLIGGVASRFVLLPGKSLVPGATVAGRELAVLRAPLIIENFEGIDVRRGARGETLIYIISDDNYNIIQRTLLLMFELTGSS